MKKELELGLILTRMIQKTDAVGRSARACVARKSKAEHSPSGGGGITRRKGGRIGVVWPFGRSA